MEVVENKYFANFTEKITCSISIYKYRNFYLVNLCYNFIDLSTMINFEERIDNIIMDELKDYIVSIVDEEYLIDVLPDDLKFSCRFIYQKDIKWQNLWKKIDRLFEERNKNYIK